MHTQPSSPKRTTPLCHGLWAITAIAFVTLLGGCSISPKVDTSDSTLEMEQEQVEPPDWSDELTSDSTPETEQEQLDPADGLASDSSSEPEQAQAEPVSLPTQPEPIALPGTLTCACTPEQIQAQAKPPADAALPMVTAREHTTKAGGLVPGFYINVGLFAVPSNGTKAYKKLKDAGLPVFSDGIKTKKGHLTRVRVGPFNARTEAETAAKQIHALKLEAVVFEH
jgi:DedD protein